MAIQVQNQAAYQALRGQCVKVTLNGTETVSKLPFITVGTKATIGSTGNVGYVSQVDTYGSSFKVRPQYSNQRWESVQSGYLAKSEFITLG
jgi:hypothetical protein